MGDQQPKQEFLPYHQGTPAVRVVFDLGSNVWFQVLGVAAAYTAIPESGVSLDAYLSCSLRQLPKYL